MASNGKTLAMMLTGHMVQVHPHLGLGAGSKLYDRRWLPEGSPLSDPDKSAITFDQVFRHQSGIIPEDTHQIASGAVQTEADWNFEPFTVGKDAQWPQSAKLWYDPGKPATYNGKAYSSVAFNHFSLIFENISGWEASEYLKRAMLGPLGVGRVAYRTTAGMGGTKWAAAGNGLMGARDFMRVGYLMLREGNWNGRRIFPASWIRRFTGSTAYQNLRSNRDCYWGAKYPADLVLPDDGVGAELGAGGAVTGSAAHLQRANARVPEGGDRPGVAGAALRRGHRPLRRVRWHRGERRRLNTPPPRR